MASGPGGSPTSEAETQADEARAAAIEAANSNRGLTVGLVGTSVAILTFGLFFLYDRAESGVFSPTLFRIAMGDLVASMFVVGYAGIFFYWQMEAFVRHPSKAATYQWWADRLFVLGLALLMAAPALILFTARLLDVGILALVLWLVMLVMLARRRPIGH